MTLLQEGPGFATPGKEAAGRIVIEARGAVAKATVYIQDISPKNTYKLALVSEQGLGVVVGNIVADQRGRYEGKFEFNSGGIGDSGMCCDQIDGAVVLVSGDDAKPAAALVGYRAAPFSWQTNLHFGQPSRVQEAQEEVTAAIAEEVPPNVYDFVIEEPSFVAVAAENPSGGELDSLFRPEALIQAFAEQEPPAQWVAAIPADVKDLGRLGAQIYDDAQAQAGFDNYKHILLGRTQQDGQIAYILGIPDIYTAGAEIAGQKSCTFKLCRPGDPIEGAHGYWLKQLE